MNYIQMIGRLTKDVELRYSAAKMIPAVQFCLAINRGKNQKGEELGTDFPVLTAYGRTAEIINKHTKKGQQIGIFGHVRTDSWNDRNGEKRFRTSIIVDRVFLLADTIPSIMDVPAAGEEYDGPPPGFMDGSDIPF